MTDSEPWADRVLTIVRVVTVALVFGACLIVLITQPGTAELLPLVLPGILAGALLALFDLDRSNRLGPRQSARDLPALRDVLPPAPGAPKTAAQLRKRRNGAYINGAVTAFLAAFSLATGSVIVGAAVAGTTVVFLLLAVRAGRLLEQRTT